MSNKVASLIDTGAEWVISKVSSVWGKLTKRSTVATVSETVTPESASLNIVTLSATRADSYEMLGDAAATRSIDQINITNITATGQTTAIARYAFSVEVTWTDGVGVQHHYGPTTHIWPNDLSDVPARIVKQWAVDLVTQAVRWRLGIDAAPEA